MLALWFSIVYISSCGFTFTCNQAAPFVERTPIPTLIPAAHSGTSMEMGAMDFDKCQVAASDLVGAWVSSGASELEPFPFVDANGQSCSGTYEDIHPLFVENGVWQSGSLGCISCHNADLTPRSGGLDMTTYDAISQSGILGGGKWETSKLYEYLNLSLTPGGHSPDQPAGNPLIYAGAIVEAETGTSSTP
jgi:hypothetical protein